MPQICHKITLSFSCNLFRRKKRRVRQHKKKLQEKLAKKLVTTDSTTGGIEEMDLFRLNTIENREVRDNTLPSALISYIYKENNPD